MFVKSLKMQVMHCCGESDCRSQCQRPYIIQWQLTITLSDHLVGLVVRCPPRASSDLGSIPAIAVGLVPGRVIPVAWKMGTPVAALPCTWSCRVRTGTCWPGVSIL